MTHLARQNEIFSCAWSKQSNFRLLSISLCVHKVLSNLWCAKSFSNCRPILRQWSRNITWHSLSIYMKGWGLIHWLFTPWLQHESNGNHFPSSKTTLGNNSTSYKKTIIIHQPSLIDYSKRRNHLINTIFQSDCLNHGHLNFDKCSAKIWIIKWSVTNGTHSDKWKSLAHAYKIQSWRHIK